MIRFRIVTAFVLLSSTVAAPLGLGQPKTGFPFASENLNYSVNWPSGLSLGEAHLRAVRLKQDEPGGNAWQFEFTMNAAVPGFSIADRFRSIASEELCSAEAEKEILHGRRKTRETTTFDRRQSLATRKTAEGGKSEIPVPACARDALTFLFFTRRELGQGRVPPAQTVLFGAPYQIRLEYTGPQTVSVNETRMEADRISASFKGPASDLTFEMFFARDPARTPVLMRAPFALGNFSMELVR